MELKSVVASVFFSSDVANPDTMNKFYADIEMLAFQNSPPDPAQFLRAFHWLSIPNKENKWQGFNLSRYLSRDYDSTIDAARVRSTQLNAPPSTSRPTTFCGRKACLSP